MLIEPEHARVNAVKAAAVAHCRRGILDVPAIGTKGDVSLICRGALLAMVVVANGGGFAPLAEDVAAE